MTLATRLSLVVGVAIVSLVSFGQAQQPAQAEQPVDAKQVREAIDRGIAYLRREQLPRGNWNDLDAYPGGVTALCTLALLHSGVAADDPTVSKALEFLRTTKPKKTYTVALQTMVLCAATPQKDLLTIQTNVRWLEENQVRESDRTGAWSYPSPSGAGGDNSNAQFAVLALYEAQRVGVKVNPQTWKRAYTYWKAAQNGDGSWGYVPGDAGSGSMTCAGIGGLATCSVAISEGDAQVKNGRILCCQQRSRDDALKQGLDWLGRNFSVTHNPRLPGSGHPCLYYYLYGLERAGRLTARRFIGDHDWYREGAEFLIHEQDPLSHYWIGAWHGERNPHISTSFALLFLAKGRRPVVLAKLRYGNEEDWNQHQNDAANLTGYTEQKWDLDLTWQIFNPASASVEDLLQAPVLYISGNRALDLLPHAQKLRDYVDRGGFMFAENCCSDDNGFQQAFRALVSAMFPEPEYALQQLPPGHPLWRMEELVRANSPYVGRLWGVEYGCRTSVVYSELDLSCYWELARPGRWHDYPEPVVERIRDGLAVGINALTYATGREPKGKEHTFTLPLVDTGVDGFSDRGTIQIAKLQHGGGCNDAPGALVNLLQAAGQGDLKLRIRTDAQLIGITNDNLANYHLVFMHGRHNFRMTPAERESLTRYLENGGTLLADAICASKPFATAFRRELQKALPNYPLETIPTEDPIFTSTYGGYDVRKVALRDPLPVVEGQPITTRVRETAPQLEGIKIGHRWAVIFSPYDISCALENHESIQCRGYNREDAARLGLNVLMYSLNQ